MTPASNAPEVCLKCEHCNGTGNDPGGLSETEKTDCPFCDGTGECVKPDEPFGAPEAGIVYERKAEGKPTDDEPDDDGVDDEELVYDYYGYYGNPGVF